MARRSTPQKIRSDSGSASRVRAFAGIAMIVSRRRVGGRQESAAGLRPMHSRRRQIQPRQRISTMARGLHLPTLPNGAASHAPSNN
jgi:hypothetical protein